MLITIEEKDNKIKLHLSEDVTWPLALQALTSTIRNLALAAVDQVSLQAPKRAREAVKNSAKEDIADMINLAISNILNEIAPKDPSLELTEAAICAAENLIVQAAAEKHLTMAEAVKEANALLESKLNAKT